MNLKKYVPRSIQNVFDRLEAFNENITDFLFSEDMDKTFEVIVYCTKNPETHIPNTDAPDLSPNVANYNFFKARSTVGHHDHLVPPENARFIDEYERLRNMHFQAILKKSSDEELPETGDVWLATQTGAGMVSLISFERKGDPNKFKIPEGDGPAQAAHTNGQSPTTSVGNVTPAPGTATNPSPSSPSTPAPSTNYTLPRYDATQKELLGFILSGEGSYNASNNGTSADETRMVNSIGTDSYVAYMSVKKTPTTGHKLLSTLTIGEIMDYQGWDESKSVRLYNHTFSPPKKNTRTLFAVGAFQIIPQTMNFVVNNIGYGRDVIFTHEVQQNLAMALIYGTKRPLLSDYLRGKSSSTLFDAMLEFSKEWASIPSPLKYRDGWTSKKTNKVFSAGGNHSHYDLPNKAGHSYADTKALLEKVRAHNIDQGFV